MNNDFISCSTLLNQLHSLATCNGLELSIITNNIDSRDSLKCSIGEFEYYLNSFSIYELLNAYVTLRSRIEISKGTHI